MRPPSGVWAAIFRGLSAPLTLFLAAGTVGLAAIIGAQAPFGQHPFEGPWAQAAGVVLIGCVLARALAGGLAVRALWAGGLVVLAIGAVLSGGEAGELRLRAGEIETYEQVINGRGAATHLGGRLAVVPSAEGMQLRLAVKERILGVAPVPAPGAEALIGPWRIHRRTIAAGAKPTHAQLTLSPRSGGDPRAVRLRAGQTIAPVDGVEVTLRRLVGDYGKALGPAALIDVRANDETTTSWYFTEAPDLDARVGTAPLVIRLDAIESTPAIVLGVRRADRIALAQGRLGVRRADRVTLAQGLLAGGFGLMLLGMGLGVLRKEAA